jgi:hypothetical protein
MSVQPKYYPDLEWCRIIAESVVEELLVAKLIREDQAEWTRLIVGQDIHIKLLMGLRPQEEQPLS